MQTRFGKFFVGGVLLGIASLFGLLALMLGHQLGIVSAIWPFVVGCLFGLFIIPVIIPVPSDEVGGAHGLLFLLAGAYSLATGDWVAAEGLRIAVAIFGVVFGAGTVFIGWLG